MFGWLVGALLIQIRPYFDADCTKNARKYVCRNRSSETSLERSFCNLTEVPREIPSKATFVNLYGNVITIVPAKKLSHLSKCVYLSLGDNYISVLHKGAFNGMKSLRTMILSCNRIYHIQYGLFTGLHNLQTLRMEENNITSIEIGSLDPLHSIKSIHLYKNKLKTLNPNTFINLPRKPLHLILHVLRKVHINKWNCSSLCWLTYEQMHGTAIEPQRIKNTIIPKCTCQQGEGCRSFHCSDPGKFIGTVENSSNVICSSLSLSICLIFVCQHHKWSCKVMYNWRQAQCICVKQLHVVFVWCQSEPPEHIFFWVRTHCTTTKAQHQPTEVYLEFKRDVHLGWPT